MKKPAIVVIVAILIAITAVVLVIKNKKHTPGATQQEQEQVDLPVNTIPVEERPFITLSPDLSGHNLTFHVEGTPKSGELEYEMVYNAKDKQEGVFGRLELATEKQPINKELLLGSRSAGGATTYHEGVTGGSITTTYGDTKLKEQFNFLHFDPTDPTFSSTDLKFDVTLPKTGLKKDNVVVVMKTFGLPGKLTGKLVAGPFAYLTPTPIKSSVEVSMKLPAGDYTNPTIYTFVDGTWRSLKTTKKDDSLTASTTIGNVFVVATQ